MELWDQIVDRLAVSVPVDIMPGANDPTSFILPQQPIHKGMFVQASQSGGLVCRTNPYHCRLDGVE